MSKLASRLALQQKLSRAGLSYATVGATVASREGRRREASLSKASRMAGSGLTSSAVASFCLFAWSPVGFGGGLSRTGVIRLSRLLCSPLSFREIKKGGRSLPLRGRWRFRS